MASRKPPATPQHANLTIEHMRKGVERLGRIIGEIEAFDASALTKRWSPEQQALEATIEGALSSVFGHGTVEYKRYASATVLDHGAVYMSFGGPSDDSQEARKYVAEGKVQAVQILRSAISWLNDEIGDAAPSINTPSERSEVAVELLQKVFIVHGHDEGARQAVARFIETLGLEAIILSEQANQGRTIIEKIEAHCNVGFAVVLLTPDDIGGKVGDSQHPRPRQNVLLELGYFLARLGRAHVCTLAKGALEMPTDFAGVVWEPFDDSGGWKISLARELKAVGFEVDWNMVMS